MGKAVHPDGLRDVRSFGRRRGRKRSARQTQILHDGLKRWGIDLDACSDDACLQEFSARYAQQWLEIGFGGGEHLIWQAERHPDVGITGAEPFEDGVIKVLTAIEERRIENIRVFSGDARLLLRRLASASIQMAFVLFPDPWPKARHAKRRLVAAPMLEDLARVLGEAAQLRIATDSADYAAEILHVMHRDSRFRWQVDRPADWRQRPQDWPETRYERKAIRAKRQPYFFTFSRIRSENPETGAD